MALTRTKFIKLLRIGVLFVAIVVIIGYAIWRSFAYAQGPSIEIYTPLDGANITAATVEVTGRALRINAITINGNPLSVDEEGNFKDTRVVFSGVNVITMVATDQFGRSIQKQIKVLGSAPSGI